VALQRRLGILSHGWIGLSRTGSNHTAPDGTALTGRKIYDESIKHKKGGNKAMNSEKKQIRGIYLMAVLVAAVSILISYMPLHASGIDDRIESAAKNSFVYKTYLKDDDINIQSKNGVVTLKGTVSEESHKSLAEDTVAGLPDVKSVDNRLKLKNENTSNNTDAWLTMKVKTALLFHKNVSGLHTDVDVKDGVVTLRGDADTEAQKELTTEYVKDVEGVKDVRNELVVSKNPRKPNETVGEKIDDASITAQVKSTLLFHRATSAKNTKVETSDGVVTLNGKARNGAEKDLATKLADDVRGVRNVVNKMTIEESKNN
jgi:hyperosmotically inducible periplasmic protein